MERDRIWTLLSRKLANEAGDAETAELNLLLKYHPELNDIVEHIIDSWERPLSNDHEFMEATYLVHLERMKEKGISFSAIMEHESNIEFETPVVANKKKKTLLYVTLCSCTLFIFILAYYSFTIRPSSYSSKNIVANTGTKKEIITENGTRTKTILPDGSVVWLNAGSKVAYDGDFSGPIRDVYLTGEAYFDVVKNPNSPFIVHTGDINVKALGTAFNIRSYALDKTVEATLLRGLIEITWQDDKNAKAIYLHPNQKLAWIKNTIITLGSVETKSSANSYTISKLDLQNEKELPETAWMFNRLSFKNDDFETLARKMERWYNIKIVFGDETIKKIHFNGSLENETVEQAFSALQMAVPFTYKINDHVIYVSSLSN